MLQKDDDTQLNTHEEIEEEVLNFYNKLMGTTDIELDGIYRHCDARRSPIK